MQIMRAETRSGEQKISTLVTEMAKFMPEELANVRDRSRVMVTCYPPGSRYTRHVDNGGGISNGRRLTTLLCAPTSPPLVSPHLRFARFFSQPHETARPSSSTASAIT
jgi:Rps23 Pro-64 3,4-dihydroxylase Tpa1-like proline 4-hydroxylase